MALAGLVVCGVLAGVLLGTTAGLAWVLARAAPELGLQGLQGSLWRGARADQARYHAPGLAIEAEAVAVVPNWSGLLAGRLELDRVQARRIAILTSAVPDRPAPGAALPRLLAPVPIRLRWLELDRLTWQTDAGAPVEAQVQLRDLDWQAGQIQLSGLLAQAEHRLTLTATIDTAADYRHRIQVELDGDPAAARPLALRLSATGDAKASTVGVELDRPGRARAQLDLYDWATALRWELSGLEAEWPEGRLVGTASAVPIRLRLDARGERERVEGQGAIEFDQERYRLEKVLLRVGDRLDLDAFELGLPTGGTLRISGQWPLAAGGAAGALDLDWTELCGPSGLGWPADLVSPRGAARLTGTLAAWRLALDAELRAQGRELRLAGRIDGSPTALVLPGLQVRGAAGALDAQGRIALDGDGAIELVLQSQRLDPGVWLPTWPGAIELDARLAGRHGGAQPRVEVDLRTLGGALRGQPLAGSGRLAWRPGDLPRGRLRLSWAGQVLDWASVSPTGFTLDLRAPRLDRLPFDLSGQLHARVELERHAERWRATGRLDADALRFGLAEAQRVEAEFAVGDDPEAPAELSLAAADLRFADQPIDRLRVRSAGTLAMQRIELGAARPGTELDLVLSGGWDGERWRGELGAVEVAASAVEPPQRWRASAPSRLELSSGRVVLAPFCLRAAPGELCLALTPAERGHEVQVRVHELPLAALGPFLPAGVGVAGRLEGALSAAVGADGPGRLEGQFRARDAVVRLDTERFDQRYAFEQVELSARGTGTADLELAGRLRSAQLGAATWAVRWTPESTEPSAVVDLEALQLRAFDGLNPELARLRGTLSGRLARSAATAVQAGLALTDFSVELPALGVRLTQGSLDLQGDSEQGFTALGRVRSGDGELRLDGRWRRDESGWRGSWALDGENLRALDVPLAQTTVTPALRIRFDRRGAEVEGSVLVPRARIDLARFAPSVSRSGDVVVIDDPPHARTEPFPVRADVELRLGADVQLRGYGLDGRLSGVLQLRDRPGRPTLARGELEVHGQYRAYGQDLKIERGKLLFPSVPLGDPGLDLRAVRVIDQSIKAGVQVRGVLASPELTVYSEPPMEQSNALSYLVLGRPLSAATAADGAALQSAAQTAGGNLLARSIGHKLGLEVAIENNAALGGQALTVGKYLSPRWYVGYGQSLLDSAQLYLVRFKLSDRYELEASSGLEQKFGANYRIER